MGFLFLVTGKITELRDTNREDNSSLNGAWPFAHKMAFNKA